MLSKEKEPINEVSVFNFFKVSNKETVISLKKKKKKLWLKRAIVGFCCVQALSLGIDMLNAKNFIDYRVSQSEKLYKDYAQFQKALRSDDQVKIIDAFTKVEHANIAISQFLTADALLLVSTQNENLSEKERKEYNIAPPLPKETENILFKIHKNNIGEGISDERKTTEIKCFALDLACYLVKPYLQKELNKSIINIENKTKIRNYNLDHLDEYKKWTILQRDANKDKGFGDKYIYIPTPGEKYYNQLNNITSNIK